MTPRLVALLLAAAALSGCAVQPPAPAPDAGPDAPLAAPAQPPAPALVPALGARLPHGLSQAPAVADGAGRVHLFGGRTPEGPSGDVLVYDVASGAFTVLEGRLPSPRTYASAAMDASGFVHVFGGVDASGAPLAEILRYHPGTGRVETLDAALPAPVQGAPVAWTGREYLLFGGHGVGGKRDAVVSFDPVARAVEVVPGARLPTPRSHMAVAWDAKEGVAYVVGGRDADGFLRDVLRYDPAARAFERLPATLPHSGSDAPGGGVYDMGAAFDPDARVLHLFGGYAGSYCHVAFPNRILRYDAWTGDVAEVGEMPAARTAAAATFDPASRKALVFGGGECEGRLLDDVLVHG